MYRGTGPFSEIENRNVRDFILRIKENLVFFNSIHSYAQLILLPWTFTATPRPLGYDAMMEVFLKGSAALTAVHGKEYEVKSLSIPTFNYIDDTATHTVGPNHSVHILRLDVLPV